jgi:PST family polysaccharide transporter
MRGYKSTSARHMPEIARSFASVFASELVSRGAIFCFGVVLARAVGPQEFGLYGLFVLVFAYLWLVSDGGCTSLGIKLVSQAETDGARWSAAGRVLGTRVASTAVVVVCLAVLATAVRGLYPRLSSWLLPGVLLLFANAFFMAWYARSIRRYGLYTLAYAGVAVSFLAASAAIVFLPIEIRGAESGIWLRSGAWAVGAMLSAALISFGDEVRQILRELRADFGLYRQSVWLGGAALLAGISPLLPMLFLGHRGSDEDLGWYSAAWQVHQVMLAGAAVFHMVFFPRVYREAVVAPEKANGTYRSMVVLAISSSVAVTAMFSLFSRELVDALFGTGYRPGSRVLTVISVAVGVVLVRYVAELKLMVEGHSRRIFAAAVVGALTCVAASYLLTTDSLGASSAYVISELAYTAALILVSRGFGLPLLAVLASFVVGVLLLLALPGSQGVFSACAIVAATLWLSVRWIRVVPAESHGQRIP